MGVAFDEDGDTSDWIEIHNPTSQKVALSGWSLTDEATDLDKWGFPADTIAAGEYLIVFASQKDRSLAGAELHTNFKLDGDGEYLALMAPGDEIASEFSPAFPHQREDVSFGTGQLVEVTTLIGSGAPLKAWVPSDDSLGNTWTGGQPLDDSAWKSGTAAVGFETQGIAANDSTPLAYWRFDASENAGRNTPDAMGNYNATVSSAQLTSGGEGRFGEAYFFDGSNDYISAGVIPELVTPSAMSISLWFKREAETSSATNHNVNNVLVAHSASATNDNFEIGTQGGNIEVYLDTTAKDGPNPSITQSAGIQNGVWHHLALTYDQSRVNEVQLYRDGQLVFESSQWGGALDTSATSPLTFGLARIDNQRGDFNGWMDEVAVWDTALTTEQVVALAEGVSPLNLFGYTSLIGLDLEQEMLEDSLPPRNSAYVRIPFEVVDPADVELLTLRMQYDDGFVAYLNGQEVARGNAPETVLFSSAACRNADRKNPSFERHFQPDFHLFRLFRGIFDNFLVIGKMLD